jgi:hypothetical protein
MSRLTESFNNHRTLELRNRTEDLSHHRGGRRFLSEVVGRIYRYQVNTVTTQQVVASKLDSEISGKTAGVLNQDQAGTIAEHVLHHLRKPRSTVDRVSTGDRLIVEHANDVDLVRSSVFLDSGLLAGQ